MSAGWRMGVDSLHAHEGAEEGQLRPGLQNNTKELRGLRFQRKVLLRRIGWVKDCVGVRGE